VRGSRCETRDGSEVRVYGDGSTVGICSTLDSSVLHSGAEPCGVVVKMRVRAFRRDVSLPVLFEMVGQVGQIGKWLGDRVRHTSSK
jgi:hypothetical protein